MFVFFSFLLLIGLVIAAVVVPRYYLGLNDQTARRQREEEQFRRILEMEKLRMNDPKGSSGSNDRSSPRPPHAR
ncbi:MAG: SlyX family protein [Synechococcaceae cyanobacterium SM2_3_2]|nr:SlyX family protein [Synechococcaceae cyanobacterium SM2_3_2]